MPTYTNYGTYPITKLSCHQKAALDSCFVFHRKYLNKLLLECVLGTDLAWFMIGFLNEFRKCISMRSFKLSLRGNVGIYHIVRIKNIEHGGKCEVWHVQESIKWNLEQAFEFVFGQSSGGTREAGQLIAARQSGSSLQCGKINNLTNVLETRCVRS